MLIILKGQFMKILGMILVAVGVVVLGFGINSTRSISEKVVETFSGRFTQQTMFYIIGGVALIVAGIALALVGKTP